MDPSVLGPSSVLSVQVPGVHSPGSSEMCPNDAPVECFRFRFSSFVALPFDTVFCFIIASLLRG